jgi:hypothetical protein
MLPGNGEKVCGGWVGGGWCRPIIVLSFGFGQAEQQYNGL